MNDSQNNRKKGGRKPKINPSIHRHVFRLTEQENTQLLSRFKASGMSNKAKFIISVLFSKEITRVMIDKGTIDFYMRLTSLYTQFRSVGVNYNQVVKLMYSRFSEKNAAALLYTLEIQTRKLRVFCQNMITLTEEFSKFIHKNNPEK